MLAHTLAHFIHFWNECPGSVFLRSQISVPDTNLCEPQPQADLRNDLFRWAVYFYRDRIRGLLEDRKLARQQLRAGKMPRSRAQPLVNLFVGSLQIDQLHLRVGAKLLSIEAFQCRACQDHVSMICNPLGHLAVDGLQPWHPVDIVEWNTHLHFFDISGRVEGVTIYELPAQTLGEQAAGSCLADSSRAHDDHDHRNSKND